jgi:hypothetical protein
MIEKVIRSNLDYRQTTLFRNKVVLILPSLIQYIF